MFGTETTKIFNFGFVKWELVAFSVLLAIAAVLACKKRYKGALLFFVVTVSIVAEELLFRYLVVWGIANPSAAIQLAVAWGPTYLFVKILLCSTLFGVWRGFRKSAILAVQAVCAAGVCLGLFFFCTRSAQVDTLLLKTINACMGGESAFQQMLGVSEECASVRQVLAEYLPAQLGYGNELAIILRDNGAYLATLVDMGYRIVFALVCYIFYLFLVFLLYIFYHIVYPERRYKRKKNRQFADNQTRSTYRKHRLGGGLIGLTRGLAVGLISMSFIGSAFYVVAGGTGKGELKEYAFGDANYDFAYSAYRSIESYGAQGIFKLLNAMQGTDRSPYYLFAADLVFSGQLNDEYSGISEHIKFRKELGAYSGFARQTLQLLMQYGEAEIKPILLGQQGGAEAMNAIVGVMAKPQFQTEFEKLIDDFDAQTYVINLALSAVNSIVCNIDETSFVSSVNETNREMLKLLFKPGHLTSVIPDERAMLEAGETATQPYIGLNRVFNKNDVKVLYRMAVSLLRADYSGAEAALQLTTELLPQLEQLSILQTSRKQTFDPVLGRLYCFLANAYLTTDGAGVRYADIADANVSWVDEINRLVSVAENGIALYRKAAAVEGTAIEKLLSIFDEDKADYADNIKMYDDACAVITRSDLLGFVLSTDYMHKTVRDLFASVSDKMYIPDAIAYTDTTDAHGELYQFLYGMRLLCNKQNRAFLQAAVVGGQIEVADMLDMLAGAVENRDEQGNTLSDYMTESVLMRSLMSIAMIENAGDVLYVPQSVLERDAAANLVNLIEKTTLKDLFGAFAKPSVRETVQDFIAGTAEVGTVLKNEELLDVLMTGNGILEGTVSKALLSALDDSDVVIPRALESVDGWISDGAPGELYKIVRAIRLSGLDFEAFLGENDTDALLDQILAIDEVGMSALLDSDVLYYTVSEFVQSDDLTLGEGFTLIIPRSVKRIVPNDSVETLIDRKELRAIFTQLSGLDLSTDSSAEDVLRQLVHNRELLQNSLIVCASAANFMVESELSDILEIPQTFIDAGQKEQLADFDVSNIWRKELIALIDSVDILFDLDSDDFTLDENTLRDTLGETLPTFNEIDPTGGKTKLQVCYGSKIVLHNLTAQLDEAFAKWNIPAVDDRVLAAAKGADGYYTLAELTALTDAMHVFGFEDKNILNIQGDTFRDTAKNELLALNRPRADFDNRSGLDVLYPSVIVISILTHEIDTVLQENLIDRSLRDSLKTPRGIYTKAEIEACIDAVIALDIASIGDLGTVSFDDLNRFESILDTLYRSKLIAGVITKAIQKAAVGTPLVDHPKAYEKEIAVYRIQEVRVLIELLDGGSVGDFRLGSAAQLKRFVCDPTTGEPQSYLLAASLSDNLLQNEGLLVPIAAVADGMIVPAELAALLDAYTAFTGGDAIGDWQVDLFVPDREVAACVTASMIIRATLTDAIRDANAGRPMLFRADHVTVGARLVKTANGIEAIGLAPMIEAEQLTAMLDVLRGHAAADEFALPTVNDLAALAQLDETKLRAYLQCDMLRYAIGDLVLPFTDIDNVETVYDLATGEQIENHKALTAEEILSFVQGWQAA